jgi:putative membrane protein
MMWAFNVGFRNLFLGAGVITGLVLLNTGQEVVGTTLVIFCCLNMVLSALLMGVSDLLGHYPKRGDSVPGTIAASAPALIALIAAAF